MDRVDLHIHSTASDGTKRPEELVNEAVSKSLAVMSITDHDTLEGIPEGIRAAELGGIEFVPGVELSVDLDEAGLTAHLLGYFPGISPEILLDSSSSLGRAIDYVQGGRSRRNPRILEKLSISGMHIQMKDVEELSDGDVVGRPHIAQAMLNAGYVGSMKEAFDRFLGKGRPAYVDRDRLPVVEAIEIIRLSGGLPVMAHPGYIEMNDRRLGSFFHRMKDCGLSGVEVFYPTHSASTVRMLVELAERLDLLVTGGTDYHGRANETSPLGGTEEGFHISLDDVSDFIRTCRELRQEVLNGETE